MLYTIIGRQTSGVEVTGYVVKENSTGAIKLIPKDGVYIMALSKQISNVTAQKFKDKIVMKGIGTKLSDLPKYDKDGRLIEKAEKGNNNKLRITITGKVVQGKGIVAYRVHYVNPSIQKSGDVILPKNKVFKYAKDGYITNARFQESNGKGILRGIDCRLASLPMVRLDKEPAY